MSSRPSRCCTALDKHSSQLNQNKQQLRCREQCKLHFGVKILALINPFTWVLYAIHMISNGPLSLNRPRRWWLLQPGVPSSFTWQPPSPAHESAKAPRTILSATTSMHSSVLHWAFSANDSDFRVGQSDASSPSCAADVARMHPDERRDMSGPVGGRVQNEPQSGLDRQLSSLFAAAAIVSPLSVRVGTKVTKVISRPVSTIWHVNTRRSMEEKSIYLPP